MIYANELSRIFEIEVFPTRSRRVPLHELDSLEKFLFSNWADAQSEEVFFVPTTKTM